MLKEKSCQPKRKLRQAVTLCNWGRLFLGADRRREINTAARRLGWAEGDGTNY